MSPTGPKRPTLHPDDEDALHHATWSPEDRVLVPPEDDDDPDSGSGIVQLRGTDYPDLDTDPPTEEADSLPPDQKITPVQTERVRAPKGPTITAVPPTDDDPSSEDAAPLPPQTTDRYEVLDLLGRGGMGMVWRVRDTRLRRRLAMKVIHGAIVSADALTRFAQEAQITGQLEHPTIVPVHDLGRLPDGSVYFTMKEVRGEALSHTLERRWRAIDSGEENYDVVLVDLIGVMVRVCEAVAFAHARGVIHRDLKPDNVMVGEFGEVQVMDWGLARLLGQVGPGSSESVPVVSSDREDSNPLRTREGSVAGTPAYMAPEQARSEADGMGPHSDIWSLGAMLYEIVCGERAFEGLSEDILRRVKAGEVVPPGERVGRAISRELESVVLRAMHAEPRQRYPSADALRADLQSWLNGRPLATVRYTARERLAKWVRRNRPVITAVGATALVAVALLSWGLFRYLEDLNAAIDVAEAEASRAREAEHEARIRLAEGQVATADALAATERFVEARALYREAIEGLAAHGHRTVGAELGLWGTYHQSRGPIGPVEGDFLGLHSDGRRALVRRGEELVEIGVPLGRRRGGWPAPTGKLVHAHHDAGGWEVFAKSGGALHRIELASGESRRLFDLDEDALVEVTPSGDRLLTAAPDGGTTLWVDAGGQPTATVLSDDLQPHYVSDDYAILSTYGGRTELWDVREARLIRPVAASYGRGAITPDGRTLVVHLEPEEVLRAEDVATGEIRWSVPANHLNPMAFSRDAGLVLAAGLGPGIQGIDMATGLVVVRMDGHPGAVRRIQVTDELVLSESEHTLVWALPDASAPLGQLVTLEGDLMEVDVDPVAGLLVGVGTRGLRMWDLACGVELPGWPLDGDPRDVQLDPTRRRALVTLSDRDEALLIDLSTGERTAIPATAQMSGTFVGEDVVVLAGSDGAVRARSISQDRELWAHPAEARAARWDVVHDPARRVLYAPAFHQGRVDVFDPQTGAVRRTLETGHSTYTVRVHPETGRLATGNAARTAFVFGPDGAPVARLEPHDGPVLGQAFSPDGDMLATADFAGPLRIFDLEDGGLLLRTDRVQTGPQVRIWWTSPRRLLTVSGDTALVRDLDAPASLVAGAALLGDGPGADPAALARVLGLHGLHRHAAELSDEAGAAPLERARSWWLAGDTERARAAFAAAEGDDALHAGWARLFADRAASRAAGEPVGTPDQVEEAGSSAAAPSDAAGKASR